MYYKLLTYTENPMHSKKIFWSYLDVVQAFISDSMNIR